MTEFLKIEFRWGIRKLNNRVHAATIVKGAFNGKVIRRWQDIALVIKDIINTRPRAAFRNSPQGRKYLPKAGWANSNAAHRR